MIRKHKRIWFVPRVSQQSELVFASDVGVPIWIPSNDTLTRTNVSMRYQDPHDKADKLTRVSSKTIAHLGYNNAQSNSVVFCICRSRGRGLTWGSDHILNLYLCITKNRFYDGRTDSKWLNLHYLALLGDLTNQLRDIRFSESTVCRSNEPVHWEDTVIEQTTDHNVHKIQYSAPQRYR